MNYLDVVLMGYKTASDFPQYIYREYKKAIDNHYSLMEFFDGCNNAVTYLASHLDELYYKRIERFNNLIDFIENDKKRSKEQKAIDIDKVNDDIKLVDKNKIGSPLLFLSNSKLTGHLFYNDIWLMLHGLQEAKGKAEKSLAISMNVSIDFKEVYEQEVTEERKAKLYADLDDIKGIPEKIAFLDNERITYLQNIPFRTFEASGKLTAGGFASGALFFDRFIELEIEKLKKQAKGPIMQIESLIMPELINSRLVEVENNLKEKIENWRMGKDKIECAAFCEMLFMKGYFLKPITKRKGPIQFALIRYGIDINVQMGTTKKEDRLLHEGRLNRFFK